MKISERHVNGVSVVDISADLSAPVPTPRSLTEKVTGLLDRGERRIVLNVAALRNVDSSFVGEIVVAYKAALSRGGILRLAHVNPQLRGVLRTTTLDAIFKSYETEADAIKSFTEPV